MEHSKKQSLRLIITILLFVVLVFLAFMTYSIQSSFDNTDRLNSIKTMNFPVLERVDANIVRIDRVKELQLQALMAGEHDLINETQPIQDEIKRVFNEIKNLDPDLLQQVISLEDLFNQYYSIGSDNSHDLIDNMATMEPETAQAKMDAINRALDDLTENITELRKASYNQFSDALAQSKKSALTNMYMGIAIGAMNLFFMGVLAYFIRNNYSMMEIITEQNANLEQRVTERTEELSQKTNDMNAMLSNMDLGVFTLTEHNKIHHEYSSYLETILDRDDLAGITINEALLDKTTLGPDGRNQMEAVLDGAIGYESINFEFNSHLLSSELELTTKGQTSKILYLTWNPIITDKDVTEKILVTVRDITRLKKLEYESQKQQKELETIAQIIKISIGKYNEFIESSIQLLADSKALIEGSNQYNSDTINKIFRNIHTVKGNARTYEFTELTDIVHEIETFYIQLKDDPSKQWDQTRLLTDLQRAQDSLARYQHINDHILGRKGRSSDMLTSRGNFISNDQIAKLKTFFNALQSAVNDPETLKEKIISMDHTFLTIGQVPLSRLIDGAMDSISSLAKELNKLEPEVVCSLHPIFLSNTMAEALKSSFMHIVRNALDHGIELPEVRKAAGKKENGSITFNTQATDEFVQIEIFDDGVGLALHKIYEKAVAQHLIDIKAKPMSPEDIAQLIFHPGLSTASSVTKVSGRGVGMDAVKSFLSENGADISISLLNSVDKLDYTAFKFTISLPREICIIENLPQ